MFYSCSLFYGLRCRRENVQETLHGVKPRVQNISILPLTPCEGTAILAAVEMKTKPTKQAVEAVLDELYPLVVAGTTRWYPNARETWRELEPRKLACWQIVARWHLSKLNARKP